MKNAYTLYWLTGQREVVHGDTIAEAFALAGYSGGAIRALDFHANGDVDDYTWDPDDRRWCSKTLEDKS